MNGQIRNILLKSAPHLEFALLISNYLRERGGGGGRESGWMDEGDEERKPEWCLKKDRGSKRETHRREGKKVKQFTQTAILSP